MMKSGITRILFYIFLLLLICNVDSHAVSLSDEVVEKLRREGRLEEWISQWQSAAQRGMYEKTTYQQLRLMKVSSNAVDTLKPLVLCVDFSDNVHTYNAAKFDTLLFSKNFVVPTGSFRDYYLENSYRKHDPKGGVYGWVRAPQAYTYYSNGDNGLGIHPHNSQGLVEDALYAANLSVNYADYDYNHDGWIDGLILIHAGPGAEETDDDWDIWSHSWSLPSMITLDGVHIKDYTIQPEMHEDSSFISIGVFCHEWGHFLGINWDEYDRYYTSEGLGRWSVMATGCYNNGGKTPAHLNAYCKYFLGWSNPVVVGSNQTNMEIPQAETSPVSYRLWTSGGIGNQFFIVENRQKTGFDSYLPGEGLLIYHVDETQANNDNEWCPGDPVTPHYRVALEQADGWYQLEGCSYGLNEGDGGDSYPGFFNQRAFDDTTSPNSHNYYNSSTQVAVWNISDSDSIMHANLDVTWSRSNLVLESLLFNDSTGGDKDGRAEPGETVKLYFILSNTWAALSGAYVIASVDTEGISFLIDSVYLGNVGSPDTVNNFSFPLEFTVASGFPSRIVNFTLHVCGNGGTYCTDRTQKMIVGPSEILLVDDDNFLSGDSNYVSIYQSALDSLGAVYDVWDRKAKSQPSVNLSAYSILIWFTGNHRDSLLSSSEVQYLMNYLDGGGKLFLTSQDAAFKLSSSGLTGDSLLLSNYLHAGYGGNCSRHLVIGEPGDPVGDTLYIYPEGSGGANNQVSKDIVLPKVGASAILKYAATADFSPTDSVAGIRYQGTFKVVFFGFGFEAIDNGGWFFHGHYLSRRVFVLQRVLNWLKGSSDVLDEGDGTTNLPKSFELYQNYPNPFNPTTKIKFKVQSSKFKVPIPTTLKIYNMLGQKVRTLVDELKSTGDYEVVWDGKDGSGNEVSSGLYFYQLKVGDYSEVKKMVLLR